MPTPPAARVVEGVDHLGIGDRVELEDEARRPAGARVLALAPETPQQLGAQIQRRDEELAIVRWREMPVRKLKSSSRSCVTSGSAVKSPRSV